MTAVISILASILSFARDIAEYCLRLKVISITKGFMFLGVEEVLFVVSS